MCLAADDFRFSIKALLANGASNLVVHMALVVICGAIISLRNVHIKLAVVIDECGNVLDVLDSVEVFNAVLMPDGIIYLEIVRNHSVQQWAFDVLILFGINVKFNVRVLFSEGKML